MEEFEAADSPLRELISEVFEGSQITEITEIGQGRGIFSRVVRVKLKQAVIGSVVVKAPALGINGEAGRSSGSYGREALAYRSLLDRIDVRTPACHGVIDLDGDPWFVLEDLSQMSTINQLDGIGMSTAQRLGDVLASLHEVEVEDELAAQLRGPGPGRFDLDTLQYGLGLLTTKWEMEPEVVAAFASLLQNRDVLVEQFVDAGQLELCHGDPRADNVMVTDSELVLLDWQQISMSFGEADLAWLLATSCAVDDRPVIEGSLISRYAAATNADATEVLGRYRIGLTRPGLAVLMLCTRDTSDPRTSQIVKESLNRIGHALADHTV